MRVGFGVTDFELSSFHYPPGQVGNENGRSDPTFMRKYGDELEKDSGKWIDSCVWHGKAHTWEKVECLVKKVVECSPFSLSLLYTF